MLMEFVASLTSNEMPWLAQVVTLSLLVALGLLFFALPFLHSLRMVGEDDMQHPWGDWPAPTAEPGDSSAKLGRVDRGRAGHVASSASVLAKADNP